MIYLRPSQKCIAKCDVVTDGSDRIATTFGNFAEQGLSLPMRN
jgi:hypothetical protein